jgi:hypothetical protein
MLDALLPVFERVEQEWRAGPSPCPLCSSTHSSQLPSTARRSRRANTHCWALNLNGWPSNFRSLPVPPPSQRVTSSNRHVTGYRGLPPHRPSTNWRLLDVMPWRLVRISSPSLLFLQAVVSCGTILTIYQATRSHVVDDSNFFIVTDARAANPAIKLFC